MTVKLKTTVRLRANSECPSHSLSNVAVRDLTFAIDEPTERGGTNLGPTPTETALGALIGCTNVIGHKCAHQLDIEIGTLTINASCEFDRRGVTLTEEIDVPFVSVTLDIVASGPASEEQLQAVGRETAKFCPLSKLFEAAGTTVVANWRTA